jgi:hypothetical protein
MVVPSVGPRECTSPTRVSRVTTSPTGSLSRAGLKALHTRLEASANCAESGLQGQNGTGEPHACQQSAQPPGSTEQDIGFSPAWNLESSWISGQKICSMMGPPNVLRFAEGCAGHVRRFQIRRP